MELQDVGRPLSWIDGGRPPSWISENLISEQCSPWAGDIFHHGTKFGAKMLIDAEIMAQNRNQRWRPSAILELLHHHIVSRSLCFSPHHPVKFYANPIHSFDLWRFDFLQNWLEMPIHAPKISVFGGLDP